MRLAGHMSRRDEAKELTSIGQLQNKKQPKPKKSQAQIDKERNKQYLDLIHASTVNGLTLFNAKRILGWGDGIFQRRTKDLKDGFTLEVEYLKKGKNFLSLNKTISFTKDVLDEFNGVPKQSVSQQNKSLLL